MDDWTENFLNGDSDYATERKAEYARLRGGGIPLDISKGDSVLVAAGLLARGYVWVRKACKVLEVTDSACLVRHNSEHEYDRWEEWIDKFLVTDIITKGA